MAIPGFLTFRDSVAQDLLKNYAIRTPEVVVVRCMYLFTMAATYPLSFFVCRHILNELIARGRAWSLGVAITPGTPSGLPVQRVSLSLHLALTAAIFLPSIGITMVVRDLGLTMSVTGSVFSTLVAFVFPPLCSLRIAWLKDRGLLFGEEREQWKWKDALGPIALLIFGITALFLCTGVTLAAASASP